MVKKERTTTTVRVIGMVTTTNEEASTVKGKDV